MKMFKMRSGADTEHRPGWQAASVDFGPVRCRPDIANDLSRIHPAQVAHQAADSSYQSGRRRLLLAAPGRQIDLSTPMGLMIVRLSRWSMSITCWMPSYVSGRITRAPPS
jgi:hypothetical protein